jgi:hypothetical protein
VQRKSGEFFRCTRTSVASAFVGSAIHDELVERLRYFDGHSDTLGLFADPGFFKRATAGVAAPFRDALVDKVAGIEARGFVLATAVALELVAGFVAIRKPGSVHPGPRRALRRPLAPRGSAHARRTRAGRRGRLRVRATRLSKSTAV